MPPFIGTRCWHWLVRGLLKGHLAIVLVVSKLSRIFTVLMIYQVGTMRMVLGGSFFGKRPQNGLRVCHMMLVVVQVRLLQGRNIFLLWSFKLLVGRRSRRVSLLSVTGRLKGRRNIVCVRVIIMFVRDLPLTLRGRPQVGVFDLPLVAGCRFLCALSTHYPALPVFPGASARTLLHFQVPRNLGLNILVARR